MICFYHTDMDGHCSAAIVHKFFKKHSNMIRFVGMNYNKAIPFNKIAKDEYVVIVDFSFKPKNMEKVLKITPNVTWIDHHKTAMECDYGCELKGIRRDGTAACELTWEYYYPDTTMPEVVRLLGDYDVWKFKYGKRTHLLQAGIRLYDNFPSSHYWNWWLNNEGLDELIAAGDIALQYRDNYYAGLIKGWSFFTEFEGYKAVCCNAGSVSSQLFDTVEEGYDIMIPFCFDGKQWTVYLYTERDDIDVSEIAKRYGGGGHKQAAGFQCKELPWSKSAE